MDQQNLTFRIFVSSTFSDFKAERNALQKRVFPKLRELCLRSGFRFQAIDLRWGVSEIASLDQKAMSICLQELRRCQTTTPRPNFIVMLGNRYGWRPLPAKVPGNEFEQILVRSATEDKQLLISWYCKDDNNVPPVYCLQPRSGDFVDSQVWEQVERRLLAIFMNATRGMDIEPRELIQYGASATEQEIYHGALSVKDASEHVFCFLRDIGNLPIGPEAKDFIDIDENGRADAEAQESLSNLKHALKSRLNSNVFNYKVKWMDNSITTDHLEKLCSDIYDSLYRVIIGEIEKLKAVDALIKEIAAQESFTERQARFFTGRADYLGFIDKYIQGNSPMPLAIFGEGGSGKTALSAFAIQQCRKAHPEVEVVFRFIGATPGSTDGRTFLNSLCRQISRDYGQAESDIPMTFNELSNKFIDCLKLASESKPLILFLDGLDQLSSVDGVADLAWIPLNLPANVRMILTGRTGKQQQLLVKRLKGESLLTLEKMPSEEASALLDMWLNDAQRTLQNSQRNEVLNKFSTSGFPLFLKLAFEEARRWTSQTEATKLSPTIKGIINDLYQRLSSGENHGRLMVSRSLGFLAATREFNGLSEDELLDILSADREVFSDFISRSRFEPPEQRLPVVVWSRLYYDLEPYLAERTSEGAVLISFFHRELAEVIRECFLAGDELKARHTSLAEYFLKSGDPENNNSWKGPSRALRELPYYQVKAQDRGALYNTLTNFNFLENKVLRVAVDEHKDDQGQTLKTHTGIFLLEEDFNLALSESGTNVRQNGVLTAFARALYRESHILTHAPEILWQQFYNRLSIYNESLKSDALAQILSSEFEKRILPGGKTWFRTLNRPAESETLVRELVGHSKWITGCAFLPDNRRAVSSSQDKTLKLWDITTGKVLRTFIGKGTYFYIGKKLTFASGDTSPVSAMALSHDGSRMVTGDENGDLRIWDIESGEELRMISAHAGIINSCAFSPDDRMIVSCGGHEIPLMTWDTETGNSINAFFGHAGRIYSCVFSPDGKKIASGGEDRTVRIWDVESAKVRLTLTGHTGHCRSCCFSPDGKTLASAGEDNTLRTWDVYTGKEINWVNFDKEVVNCNYSPDGKTIILVTGSKVEVLDAKSGAEIHTFIGETEGASCCAYSTDGRMIVSGNYEGKLKLWDMEEKKGSSSKSTNAAWVDCCVISPDGRSIVSGDTDGKLVLWDAVSAKEIKVLASHYMNVNSLSFSPDGNRVLSAGYDHTLKICDLKSGSVKILGGHSDMATCCSFSLDGKILVTGGFDGKLIFWDVSSGKKLLILKQAHGVRFCVFSPDGKRIASAGDDHAVRIWDAGTGKEINILTGHARSVTCCAFSPDGKLLISGSWDGTLRLWDGVSGELLGTFGQRTSRINNCAFFDDGKKMALLRDNGIIEEFDAETGKFLFEVWNHYDKFDVEWDIDQCDGFGFSPDGKRLVSASPHNTIKIWDTESGQELKAITGHKGKIFSCAFSPDGTKIISAGSDSTLKLWDVESGAELKTFTGHEGVVFYCTFSKDGTKIASTCGDNNVKIWDAESGRQLMHLGGHANHVSSAAFTPGGEIVVSASADKTLMLWNAGSGERIKTLKGHTSFIESCAVSPDGEKIVSSSYDNTLKLWDRQSSREIKTLTGHTEPIFCCAFSGDSKKVISGSWDKTLKIWDAESGAELLTLSGHTDRLRVCIFSPDDSKILSAGEKGDLKLWDVKSGRELRSFIGHRGLISCCAFLFGGKEIISGSWDGTVRLWDAISGQELANFPVSGSVRSIAFNQITNRLCIGSAGLFILESQGLNY